MKSIFYRFCEEGSAVYFLFYQINTVFQQQQTHYYLYILDSDRPTFIFTKKDTSYKERQQTTDNQTENLSSVQNKQ